MALPSTHQVTQLLKAWTTGDKRALDKLRLWCMRNWIASRSAAWLVNAPATFCKRLRSSGPPLFAIGTLAPEANAYPT